VTAVEDRPEPAPAVRTEARAGFAVEVVHRPLADYDALAGLVAPRASAGRNESLVGAA
jgi:hypothetical protein